MPLPRLAQIKLDHNLRSAARQTDLALAASCLKEGANPNTLGRGALQDSANSAPHPRQLDMARLLMANGAHVGARGADQNSALHLAVGACNEPMTRLLLDAGANPNARDAQGRGPLARVCEPSLAAQISSRPDARSEGLRCAQALLEAGADINLADCQRERPLHLAINQERVDFALFLIQAGAGLDLSGKNNRPALYDAAYNDLPEVCVAMLDKGADATLQSEGLDFFTWLAIKNTLSLCASALPAWREAKALKELLEPNNALITPPKARL